MTLRSPAGRGAIAAIGLATALSAAALPTAAFAAGTKTPGTLNKNGPVAKGNPITDMILGRFKFASAQKPAEVKPGGAGLKMNGRTPPPAKR